MYRHGSPILRGGKRRRRRFFSAPQQQQQRATNQIVATKKTMAAPRPDARAARSGSHAFFT
jgi:hypothetical protein